MIVLPTEIFLVSNSHLIRMLSDMLMQLISHNDQIPVTHVTLTRFHSRAAPAISLLDVKLFYLFLVFGKDCKICGDRKCCFNFYIDLYWSDLWKSSFFYDIITNCTSILNISNYSLIKNIFRYISYKLNLCKDWRNHYSRIKYFRIGIFIFNFMEIECIFWNFSKLLRKFSQAGILKQNLKFRIPIIPWKRRVP